MDYGRNIGKAAIEYECGDCGCECECGCHEHANLEKDYSESDDDDFTGAYLTSEGISVSPINLDTGEPNLLDF